MGFFSIPREALDEALKVVTGSVEATINKRMNEITAAFSDRLDRIEESLEARIAKDLVEFLFRKLTEKGVLDKELYGVAMNISAGATKIELKKKLKN